MSPEVLTGLAPILVAVLTLIGGGLVYGWQKRSDRRNQILAERRQLYREFVSKVQFLQMDIRTRNWDHAHGNFTDYRALLAQLIVTAPDSVVGPLKGLDENFSAVISRAFGKKSEGGLFDAGETMLEDVATEELRKRNSELFGAAILEMRKDSFKTTHQSAGNVANQYPNGW